MSETKKKDDSTPDPVAETAAPTENPPRGRFGIREVETDARGRAREVIKFVDCDGKPLD